jgi:hypothetical protein
MNKRRYREMEGGDNLWSGVEAKDVSIAGVFISNTGTDIRVKLSHLQYN